MAPRARQEQQEQVQGKRHGPREQGLRFNSAMSDDIGAASAIEMDAAMQRNVVSDKKDIRSKYKEGRRRFETVFEGH